MACRTASSRTINAREPEWWSNTIYKQHLEQTMVKKRLHAPNRNAIKNGANQFGGASSNGGDGKDKGTNRKANNYVNTNEFAVTPSRQTGLNRLGGQYQSGKPLPLELRAKIITMSEAGAKPTEISKELKVSHGGVSKIIARYRAEGTILPNKIGGSKPKKSRPEILAAIQRYRDGNPNIRASAIQVQLLNENIVKPKQLPSISLINRIIRYHLPQPNSVHSTTSRDTDSTCSTDADGSEGFPLTVGDHNDMYNPAMSSCIDQLSPSSSATTPTWNPYLTELNEFLKPNQSTTVMPTYELEPVVDIGFSCVKAEDSASPTTNDEYAHSRSGSISSSSFYTSSPESVQYMQLGVSRMSESPTLPLTDDRGLTTLSSNLHHQNQYSQLSYESSTSNLTQRDVGHDSTILINDIVASYNSDGLPVLDLDDCIYGL